MATLIFGVHISIAHTTVYSMAPFLIGVVFTILMTCKAGGVHPYEYKELRLGVGSFCYGAGFYWDFCYQRIAPGYQLSDSKTRVWIGSWDEVTDLYSEYFLSYWGYAWYPINYDSLTAYNYAYSNSYDHRGAFGTFSYFYNNMGEQSITFPAIYWLTISAKDEYGLILYNSDIYLDCTWVGCGEVTVQIVPGWHFIDATNPVYDEYLGYEVWVQYGIGSFYISGSTYHEILY